MLRSIRWPWLTVGWEVVEDVEREKQIEHAMEVLGYKPHKEEHWIDVGYFYAPYVPIKQEPVVFDPKKAGVK